MTEHGPFAPNPDGKTLTTNYDMSWNKVANMLYIEAPAGVGFSYSNDQSDYVVGDSRTASDNYLAILAFLQKFPQYNQTGFYISSESYGGHYAPTLARAILSGNAAAQNPYINLKGIMVGNPFTNNFENSIGTYVTFFGHGLISHETWVGLDTHCFRPPNGPDEQCAAWESVADQQIGNVDPYGLDYPVCISRSEPVRMLEFLNRTNLLPNYQYPYDPCRDDYTIAYMNQPSLIAAIHANPNLGYQWDECSDIIRYNSSDMDVDMVPVWQELIADGSLHLTVYSGDDDSVCGLLGTQHWVATLGLPVVAPWTSWTDPDGQVGGYVTKYSGFNLVTVHSAGHTVPTFQPKRALALLEGYLAGNF